MKVALTLCVFGAVLAELSSARQFLFDEQILEEGNGDPADKIRTVDAAITSKETEEDDYNDLDDSEDASIPYITEEEEIKLRIENFKMELRNKLPGLPPLGTGMTSLPPAFKSIRDSQLQRNGTEQTKLSQQVLVADTANEEEDGIKLHFDLQRIISKGNIVNIQLWLYTRSSQAGKNHSYVVTESPGLSNDKPPAILASETGSDKAGWISFVIALSDKYTSGVGRAFGLKVRCATCSNGFLPVVLDVKQHPFLVVDYTPRTARSRRSTQCDWCRPNQLSCCRMHLMLNFEEARFGMILYPPTVQINFCRGSCVTMASQVNKREDGIKMHFDLQRIPSEGNIVSIKLWLHTRSSQAGNNHSYVVTESPGLSDEKPPVILASETGSDKSGWISFEITLSNKYTSGIGRALGLKVRCATCSNGFLPVVLDGDQQPFLVVDYTQSIARAKRSTRSNWCAPNQSSCCRMRFELNFNEVGLYEVLAPPSVEFNFCRGSCVAMVSQALVGNRTLGAYLPQPEGCCRPKELSSFPIVIYSRGHVVLQYLRESVVESCGCS